MKFLFTPHFVIFIAFSNGKSTCVEDFIADTYCDDDNNNADCDFDGGMTYFQSSLISKLLTMLVQSLRRLLPT